MSKVLLFGGRQKSKLIDNMLHKSNFPPSVIYDDKLENLKAVKQLGNVDCYHVPTMRLI